MERKKSLGQHFLTSKNIAARIADAASLSPEAMVLEIGPGEGILTHELLLRAKRVVAIEKDDRLIPFLSNRFENEIKKKKLTLVHGDALVENIALPPSYTVAANIPYYITGALIRKLLTSKHPPQKMVLLLQREVAERIARSPKESLLSLSVKVYGTPKMLSVVKPGNFSPPPKVDSAILEIGAISHKNFARISEKTFFRVLHAGFAHKRKLLLGNLGSIANKKELEMAFLEIGIPLKARAEDVPLILWLLLAERLKNHLLEP